jgi:hypothetical protein
MEIHNPVIVWAPLIAFTAYLSLKWFSKRNLKTGWEKPGSL